MTSSSIHDRLQLEAFVYTEAELLDAWLLDEWLALFAPQCVYEVAPTGEPEALSLASSTSFFLIADDRERLEQRVIRMKKPTAHVEYPHSRTRHLYTNVRWLGQDGETIIAAVNFATYRTKDRITSVYPGTIRYRLIRSDDSFLISTKRIVLDLDALVPQGKLSILL